MTFNEKIDKYMIENNIDNLKQLAIQADIPYTTLKDFYDKKSADNSRLSTIRKLSKFMNCSMDYLSYDEIKDISSINFDNATLIDIDSDTIMIPVLGVVKAGTPIEAQQDILEYIDIPKSWTKGGKKFYGLFISGDSMSPKYNEKDIVIFEQTEDKELANGKDCVVMVNGDDATFKNVTITDIGIQLTPFNPNNSDSYMPTFYNREQIESLPVRIIGVAREKRTRL